MHIGLQPHTYFGNISVGNILLKITQDSSYALTLGISSLETSLKSYKGLQLCTHFGNIPIRNIPLKTQGLSRSPTLKTSLIGTFPKMSRKIVTTWELWEYPRLGTSPPYFNCYKSAPVEGHLLAFSLELTPQIAYIKLCSTLLLSPIGRGPYDVSQAGINPSAPTQMGPINRSIPCP